ncbi:MAG: hypothetical protein K2N38_06380 [Oscillospiraceae bacterium]|nr:hypothetical protein [Oscillospiraceae bacterium]
MRTIVKEHVAETVTSGIFAPVMCDFVGWVLRSAVSSGITRLYFLARDGWIMYNIARIVAERNKLDIELRYLYCSRMSLRNAALEDLGAEAYRYLLEGGFALTPRTILGRLGLDGDERAGVYSDIGFAEDENIELGKTAAAEICNKLRNSAVYNDYIRKVSRANKALALGYLRQEGLLDDVKYALVDSGWTGSMQRMFRVLTGRRQTGYYFGLYAKPNTEDGEFNAYLFDRNTPPRLVSKFNNNLFETLCSAPHGMTTGYERRGDEYFPLLKEKDNLNSGSRLPEIQERMLYERAREYILPEEYGNMKRRQAFAFPLLATLMYKPTAEVAEEYGALRFSDDPAELYAFPLAAPLEEPRRLYFLPRLYEKFFRKGKLAAPLYWGYGAAVLSGKGSWARVNLRLWEIVWLIKRR